MQNQNIFAISHTSCATGPLFSNFCDEEKITAPEWADMVAHVTRNAILAPIKPKIFESRRQ